MKNLNRISEAICRWASTILFVGLILAAVGLYYSFQLYKSLRPDLEQLLPRSARSVVDLDEVTKRFQALDHLAVLVFSDDTKASKRFVDDLSNKLKDNPKNLIDRVEKDIAEELKFFNKRQALYLDVADLKKIRDYVRDRIEYETDLHNPLNIFSEIDISEPKLDLKAITRKYQAYTGTYSHFPQGYFATSDERKRAMLVYMNGRISEIDQIKKLRAYVDEVIAELNPKSYASDLQVKYTGELENMLEEQASLTSDLEISGVIVLALVSFVMLAFFKNFRATFALVASLFISTAWTFGIAYFLVGFLNANSAFLGSIIIGNGINFGIIFLARYLEERRHGKSHQTAQESGMLTTAGATWVAALAAGLSYGSLMLTDFRGFSQFGAIGLIGMVLCWIGAFTILPSMLTVFDRRKPLVNHLRSQPKSMFTTKISQFVSNWPKVICFSSFILTLGSVYFLTRLNADILEADLGKIRSKSVVEHGAGYYDRVIDEIFRRYLTPVVILPRTRKDTHEIEALLKKKKNEDDLKGLIASVQSISFFIPKDQEEKIGILEEINSLLPPHTLRRMSESDQNLVKKFLSKEVFQVVKENDLPPLVKKTFKEKDGSFGKLILVEPPVRKGPLSRPELLKLVNTLRQTADSVAPGTPVAGALPVSADILSSIATDGPRATLFAFLAVVILVIFLFRRPSIVAMVLAALFLGVVWMSGIIVAGDFKINFLNFIAFPITFGIGVDYGVNVFQRYRQEGSQNIAKVIRYTGGAVGLCSMTTIIGYGSLLIAQSQAFVSFGVLAVIGEITCVIAAIISLPALLILKDRFSSQRNLKQKIEEEKYVSPRKPPRRAA